MRTGIIVIIAIMITGCIKYPMNITEFKADSASSTKVIDLSYNKVKKSLFANLSKCYNVTYSYADPNMQRNMTIASNFHVETNKLGKSHIQYVVRNIPSMVSAGIEVPKDGMYVYSVDVSKVNNKSARLVIHAGMEAKEFSQAVEAWASGKSADCVM